MTMNERLIRFTELLRKLFEIDKSDLDFGIYRVIKLRNEQIEEFLMERLPDMVRKTLVPFAQDGKTDIDALETDVYSGLFSFFNRYYEDGDFISKRRYREGVYAIPYEGEEVKLYWANQDQYYIKTSENFTDYAFIHDLITVRFCMVEATTEQNNNKESSENKRTFMLFSEDEERYPGVRTFEYDLDNKTVIIRFVYDIPKDKKKKYAEENFSKIKNWINDLHREELYSLINVPDNEKCSEMEKRINDYMAKNTFDYFIHKDLRSFLKRELDFYIKSEVVHLDDFNFDSTDRTNTFLAKVKAIKLVGGLIIDFFAQLEDFQKKLWLKKKFIVDTNWCISLDKIDVKFWQEIISNKAQIDEWIALYGIDKDGNWSNPPTVDFLNSHKNLVIDTSFFPVSFTNALLESISKIDENTNGTMIFGDSFHSLNLLKRKYKGSVRCVYIDPPFNTGSDGFCYKDGYAHSSWMTMMRDRLEKANELMTDDGTIYTQIDYYEKERLKLLMDELFKYQTEIIWRIGWLSGYKTQAKKFIRNHDTIYQYSKSNEPLFNKTYIPYPEGYTRRDGKAPDAEGYPLEDTWNCYALDELNSIQIVSFSKEKVGDATATQKPEALLDRMIVSSSNKGDVVLDFFGGTGTTMSAAYKANRKFIIMEMSHHQFFDNELPRAKKMLYGDKYGISEKYGYPHGGIVKYLKMESYEDTLANIEFSGNDGQLMALLGDEYLIHYMVDFESRDSLLDVESFSSPFSFSLKTTENNELKERKVDLVETFNYLIGLTLTHQSKILTYHSKPNENPSYEGAVELVKDDKGEYSFQQLEGLLPDGQRVLVIWRTVTDNLVESNAALDEFFTNHHKDTADRKYDIIFVNGDNNLENLRSNGAAWKIRIIENEFKNLMFEEA